MDMLLIYRLILFIYKLVLLIYILILKNFALKLQKQKFTVKISWKMYIYIYTL